MVKTRYATKLLRDRILQQFKRGSSKDEICLMFDINVASYYRYLKWGGVKLGENKHTKRDPKTGRFLRKD